METKRPAAGEIYRHFKGNLYQIITLAKDSETGQELVVYQALYAPFGMWVRPLAMFMEPVDREKYPQAAQAMRFERVDVEKLQERQRQTAAVNTARASGAGNKTISNNNEGQPVGDEELRKALMSGNPEKYLSQRMTEQEIAHRGMLSILDASSYRERRQLLMGLRPYIDKLLLHNIAVALDIVLEEAPLDEQFESLLHCVDAHARYEGGRLR